jgi:hypothetical protein
MPGASLVALLAACLAGIAAVAGLAAGIPAWRAAARSPVETLRGADVAPPARSLPLPGGAGGLGMRLAAARPPRTATVAVVVGTSASVVLLLLALATFLAELERRPQAIGKQYQLEVSAPAADVARVRRLPGVESATTRYETSVADSFDLGESFDLVAYPGDHAAYEAPSLAAGRRVRGPGETEVGLALAQDLDLHLGGTLAVQALTGTEVRFRVVGLVESFENEGRVAYVQPRRILAADPTLPPTIAVRLEPGASAGAVRREFIRRQLPEPREPAGFIGRRVSGRSGFLATIVAVLRTVAAVDLAVCLYAFAQMLALTAQERRRTVALVRAVGGSAGQVLGLFAGAALVVGLLAAPLAIALERWTLGPAVGHLAVSYVTLPLAAGGDVISVVLIALALGTTAASAWVARSALREPVAAGLADE